MKLFVITLSLELFFPLQTFATENCGFPFNPSYSMKARIADCNEKRTSKTEATISLVTRIFQDEETKEVWKQTKPEGLIWSDAIDRLIATAEEGEPENTYTWDELIEQTEEGNYYERRYPKKTICQLAAKTAALGGLTGLHWRLPQVTEFASIGVSDQPHLAKVFADQTPIGLSLFQLMPNMDANFWTMDPYLKDGWSWYFPGLGQRGEGAVWFYYSNAPAKVRCVAKLK